MNVRAQRGGGLIDVLMAMGVLSGAVASLAQLQAFTFRECADARLRSVATLLARAKLDDLRAYSQLAAGPPGVFAFDEIGNDSGGTEDGEGRLRLAAGSVLVDGVPFERSWTAAPRSFCAADAAPIDSPCTSRPSLLALTVVIAWTDREGRPQRVVLEGSAAALDPLFGAAPVPI
jgi:hypothetical protein